MANKEMVRELGIKDEDAERISGDIIERHIKGDVTKIYDESIKDFVVDTILKGKIIDVIGNDVIVDIGYKSEGIVKKDEFINGDIKAGAEIEVLLEQIENESGTLMLSKQKADKLRGWERIIKNNKENDVLKGKVTRKVKGGLLVDVGGVSVFLPASQADIRRIDDIDYFIGKEIECSILKIDKVRMNIIVSRRKFMEDQRADKKAKLLAELKEGDIVKGVVKNIADYGVFIDLGGIDGLLHIADMSWGRVSHPSEVVKLEQEITVKVLKIDKTNDRIALGLKQLEKNPWEGIANKYPINSKVKGKVVNLVPYGAFLELEEGIEGLVHISEMSWTKRINHPSEILSIGDIVETVVLAVDSEKQELSLGIKQTTSNPWDTAAAKYKVGSKVAGRVRNLAAYGAFVELPDGIDGLLHINDMSWTKKIMHPSEVVKRGEKVEVVILSVQPESKRLALGLKQLMPNPWETTFPQKYVIGTTLTGKVVKLVSFGAFVELERDLEGLLHMPKGKDEKALQFAIGDLIEVKVVKFEPAEARIGLTFSKVVESKKTPESGAEAKTS